MHVSTHILHENVHLHSGWDLNPWPTCSSGRDQWRPKHTGTPVIRTNCGHAEAVLIVITDTKEVRCSVGKEKLHAVLTVMTDTTEGRCSVGKEKLHAVLTVMTDTTEGRCTVGKEKLHHLTHADIKNTSLFNQWRANAMLLFSTLYVSM